MFFNEAWFLIEGLLWTAMAWVGALMLAKDNGCRLLESCIMVPDSGYEESRLRWLEVLMILEAIDQFYGMSQLVGKIYGFIDARDAGISDEQSNERHVARFSSSDAGWTELEIELPADARFDHALSGPLTRAAGWMSVSSRSEIREFMEHQLHLPGGTWRAWKLGDSYHASADGAAITIRVFESKRGTQISIKQQRTREGLKVSMRSRLRPRRPRGAE